MRFFKNVYRDYRDLRRQRRINAPYQIRFFNFWEQDIPDMWFYKFIESRRLLKGKEKRICFFSTLGERDIIKRAKGDVNIFFTGENVESGIHRRRYSDHLLNEECIDLALGFDYFEDPRYMRFPLWLLYMFDPSSNEEDIVKRCSALRHPTNGRHHKFVCMISRADVLGIRQLICEQLSGIGIVDCAGKLLHNCDDLWSIFSDDKSRYISEYRFNICPENSNCYGYVTEKVFQAIDAGCIPIYWGSYNIPEPKVLNSDAIIFWDKDGDNSKTLEFISELNDSPSLFDEYSHQPRLKDGAEEFIIKLFNELENRIKDVL